MTPVAGPRPRVTSDPLRGVSWATCGMGQRLAPDDLDDPLSDGLLDALES